MPGLDADVIRYLLSRAGDSDAVVPAWDGDIEPLHAVYATRTRPIAEACLQDGRAAMRDFLPRIDVTYVTEDELASLAGSRNSFLNVNTPNDLAAVGGHFEESSG